LAVEGDYSYNDAGELVGLVYHQGATVLNSYAWTYSGDSGSPLPLAGEGQGVRAAGSACGWLPTGGLMPIHNASGVADALMFGGPAGFDLLTSCTSTDGTASYSYDPTGQLVEATFTGGQANESYAWDANGNPAGSGYIVGAGNRLLSDGVYRYGYDSEGSRSERFVDVNADGILDAGDTDISEYTWDNRNRLVKVTDYATFGGNPTQIVGYSYDIEDRWIGEQLDTNGDGVVDHQLRFAYDGNQIVLEFEKDGSGAVTGADLSHRYLWQSNAVDQLMADERTHLDAGNIVSDEVLWALTDQQGTVRDLAKRDATTGATSVVDHVVFDSFGKVTSESNPAEGSLFKYTGRPTDTHTGTEFHGHRVKRAGGLDWDSEDPIETQAGDPNTRRFCFNSPTNLTDPSGLEPDEVVGFDYEDMYTLFLERYGNEGMGLLAWATNRGWTVEKREYGWISLRHDWWLEEGEKVIAIGNTDYGGITYRSASNAADQLIEALRSMYSDYIRPEMERKEMDAFLGDDYVKQPWYVRYYRFNTAWMCNSWVGSWVKNGYMAWTGKTILGERIGGWDRVKLGALSSVEAVLLAMPAAKLAKLGVGSLGGEAVARIMSVDLLMGMGERVTTRLAASRAGQAFLRAYAKVYSKKWNVAVWGEKANIYAATLSYKCGGMTAEKLAIEATHNGTSTTVVLGKFGEGGIYYSRVGEEMGATYLSLGRWEELSKILTKDELWEINKAFLKQQTAAGKEFILSHNPETATKFFKREVDFLRADGYHFVRVGGVWKAIK
jgi:RHS repeat-associated protein